MDALEHVDADLLGWWLCERQLPNGGLNGRPEKLEDVCYSWWCLSALSILGRLHWIDGAKLTKFILSCQVRRRPATAPPLWRVRHRDPDLVGTRCAGWGAWKRCAGR